MDLFYLTIRYLRKPLRSSPIYPLYHLRHIFLISLSFSQLISYDYSKIITYDLSYDIDVQWIRKFIERSKDRLLYSSYIFYEAAMIFFCKERTLFLLVWPIVWNSTSKVLLFFSLVPTQPPPLHPPQLVRIDQEGVDLSSVYFPSSSQLYDIRRTKLYFAAILHLLDDLITSLVRALSLLVFLYLHHLKHFSSEKISILVPLTGRWLLSNDSRSNRTPWLFVSENSQARFISQRGVRIYLGT